MVKVMVKVWVLERFVTLEMVAEEIKKLREVFSELDEKVTNKELYANMKRVLENMEDVTESYWRGIIGKSNYSTFIREAREAMHRNPSAEFRVVEAEIEENAWSWTGYKTVEVNDGIYKYLLATKARR